MHQALCNKRGQRIIVAVIGLASLTGAAFANSRPVTQVGQYLTVANTPSAAQMDLLSQTIQLRFPQAIQTVGEAMAYVLRYSGYSLVGTDRQSDALKNTLSKLLPLVDRELQPMTLKDALLVLAGPAFTLVHDPFNREVDFRVKPAFVKKSKPSKQSKSQHGA